MESLAPPVVAVVVAHDPGPWFEEALASLGGQDYAELSVLVLDAASDEDITARVATVIPSAFVRRLEENRGFGATADEVGTMVDGASYYLFCHDDVALAPDAVHILVEEAFRSNAGIVTPKVVSWDDPARLLHVGMALDKGGGVVERVQPHEIDHGQHDAVRDVFVAPGGCTLVRADLFAEIGGYDPVIVAMGEDLDLSWRAQVAGARIIVAPDASVRHREELASGTRPVALAWSDDGTARAGPGPSITLQELQRRHELRSVLVCYSGAHLARVVPQLAVLAAGEVLVALLAGNRRRATAVLRAWQWNVGQLRATGHRRAGVQGSRRLRDKEIRVLQSGGSARLLAYARRVVQHGFHGAQAVELDDIWMDGGASQHDDTETNEGSVAAAEGSVAVAEGSVAVAGRRALSSGGPGPLSTGRGHVTDQVRLAAWLATALVLVIGTRGLLAGSLPSIGQFAPFPGWSGTFAQFGAAWHPAGVGSTAPATPAFALVGLVGTALMGAMGLAQKALILGCIPIGAWGVVRLLRPFGSLRAGMVGGLAYLALPLPYDALARGRWGALVVYAGAPWAMAVLFGALGTPPFGPVLRMATGVPHSGRRGLRSWMAGHPLVRRVLGLGLLEAVLVSFVPAAALAVALVAVALVAASLVHGQWVASLRSLGVATGAIVTAAALCLPWLVGVLSSGHQVIAVFGIGVMPADAPSWSQLLRFSAGPIGGSPLTWGFAAAALLPLVLGRGPRFAWAGRCWSVALTCWVTAWLIGRGWTGHLAVDPLVLLGPAAVAIAVSIGLGIAAFEEDLRATAFGWRQVASVLGVAAVGLGALPVVVSTFPGRFDLPTVDFTQVLGWMPAKAAQGTFRVLWLGDPRALDQGAWSAGSGLAYATSADGVPNASVLWNPPSPGPAARLGTAVDDARAGRTDQLGSLLAPAGVRYVVVVNAIAPVLPGVQTPPTYPLPPHLLPALDRQLDLVPVLTEGGITVFENADWLPIVAAAPTRSTSAGARTGNGSALRVPSLLQRPPGTSIVPGAVAALRAPAGARSFKGELPAGTLLAALAPSSGWRLTDRRGVATAQRTAFGWSGQYRIPRAGVYTLGFDGGLWAWMEWPVETLAWLALLVLVLSGRPRSGIRRDARNGRGVQLDLGTGGAVPSRPAR